MMLTARFALISGVILCLLAVVFGAFGAHALADVLESHGRNGTFELANRYQFYHGLALIVMGVLDDIGWVKSGVNGLCMLIGVCVFSGSLYGLALLDISWFGAITPIGGSLLLVAWGGLLSSIWFNNRRD